MQTHRKAPGGPKRPNPESSDCEAAAVSKSFYSIAGIFSIYYAFQYL